MFDTNKANYYYGVLGLNQGASQQDIKKAYRDLCKLYHPDKFSDRPELQQRYKERLILVLEAYKYLSEIEIHDIFNNKTTNKNNNENYYNTGPDNTETKQHKEECKKEEFKEDETEECNEGMLIARPWVRFWARIVDIIIYSTTSSIIIAAIEPSLLNDSRILGLFIWPPMEAFSLSVFGNTPGKWFLKTKIIYLKNNSIPFYVALRRSFSVWFFGLGAGIPIISFVALFHAYGDLVNTGITP